jgi:hypothetical protein
MPQTLMALLSMMLLTLFTYNQHRSVLQMREDTLYRDIELRGTGVAVDHLEALTAVAFDAATVDDTLTSAFDLTDTEDFGDDGTLDDLDDYHGLTLTDTRTTAYDTLYYGVETEIAYVEEFDLAVVASSPTRYKRATVRVYSLDVAFADTFALTQLYSCEGRCSW